MIQQNKIEINGLFSKLKIEIRANHLIITKKTWKEYLEYEIFFDDIELTKTVTKELNRDLMGAGFIIFALGILINLLGATLIFTILLIISIILFVSGFFTRKNKIIIPNYTKNPIILNFNKKNETDVRNFADKILLKTKEYLTNKYSKIDKDLPIENQLTNIEFLLRKDLIDENRFEELKNMLLGKDKGKKLIGYD